MKKRILSAFRPIFILIRDIFPYALLIYLILFLLENLLPGFVSNNFDLNNVLVVVLILGFFSVFAPVPEKQEELPQKNDLHLILGLAVVSFLILFFKTNGMGIEGIIIALGGSILVAGMSAVIIYFPDEDKEQVEEEVKTGKKHISHIVQLPKFYRSDYSKLAIPLCIVFIMIGFFIYKPSKKNVNISQEKPIPTVTITPEAEVMIKPDQETLQKITIDVLNGGSKTGSASAMATLLTEKGFKVGTVGDADRKDYTDALIRFRPEEYEVAKYLIDSIQGMYPDVARAPLDSDKPQIILILGKP